MTKRLLFISFLMLLTAFPASSQNDIQVREPGFKVFQFPRTAIPRIDGDFSDWSIVPDTYSVGIDEMWDDSGKHRASTVRHWT